MVGSFAGRKRGKVLLLNTTFQNSLRFAPAHAHRTPFKELLVDFLDVTARPGGSRARQFVKDFGRAWGPGTS